MQLNDLVRPGIEAQKLCQGHRGLLSQIRVVEFGALGNQSLHPELTAAVLLHQAVANLRLG